MPITWGGAYRNWAATTCSHVIGYKLFGRISHFFQRTSLTLIDIGGISTLHEYAEIVSYFSLVSYVALRLHSRTSESRDSALKTTHTVACICYLPHIRTCGSAMLSVSFVSVWKSTPWISVELCTGMACWINLDSCGVHRRQRPLYWISAFSEVGFTDTSVFFNLQVLWLFRKYKEFRIILPSNCRCIFCEAHK
jgi:hypothetical protein